MGEIEYPSSLIYLVKELCRSSKTLRGNLMEDNSCQVLTIGDQCQGCCYADRSLPGGSAKIDRRRSIEGEIDRRRSISVVGGRLREKSIVGGRLREKGKKKKWKRRKKRKEYLFPCAILVGALSPPAGRQCPRAVAARGSPVPTRCRRPRVAGTFSSARGDGTPPHAGRKVVTRGHFFSRARRRNVSPCGEKGRG
ncbi:hypothetical protein BHM03_00016336, partial [Ensete ventricosum]